MMFRYFAKNHNKIQFFGYEVANLVLVAQQLWFSEGAGYGLNGETLAALSFLLGSALVWRFDGEKRPQLLFYAGIALAFGGGCLMLAGYTWTGLSVLLASLETARGGRVVLMRLRDEYETVGMSIPSLISFHCTVAEWSLSWYCYGVNVLIRLYPDLGRFINERPFVTSTMIKAPLRLEFIVKKLLVGDWVGAGVGLSWLLLGDLALAMNDEWLRGYAEGTGERLERGGMIGDW